MPEIWEIISSNYIASLLALIALFFSFKANSIAKKSQKHTEETNRKIEHMYFFEKRTELLNEIDTIGVLLQHQLHIVIDRLMFMKLKTNDPLFIKLNERLTYLEEETKENEKQRGITEKITETADMAIMEETLADTRGTKIRLTEQIRHQETEFEKY